MNKTIVVLIVIFILISLVTGGYFLYLRYAKTPFSAGPTASQSSSLQEKWQEGGGAIAQELGAETLFKNR